MHRVEQSPPLRLMDGIEIRIPLLPRLLPLKFGSFAFRLAKLLRLARHRRPDVFRHLRKEKLEGVAVERQVFDQLPIIAGDVLQLAEAGI